jgi:hypothetical protein
MPSGHPPRTVASVTAHIPDPDLRVLADESGLSHWSIHQLREFIAVALVSRSLHANSTFAPHQCMHRAAELLGVELPVGPR